MNEQRLYHSWEEEGGAGGGGERRRGRERYERHKDICVSNGTFDFFYVKFVSIFI